MTVFYSPQTGFFYDDRVCTYIPDDAREFAVEDRDALLAQANNGKRISNGPDDWPVLIDASPLAEQELAQVERYWRSVQLIATDGVVSRHRDELEDVAKTTLTAEQYSELQAYRRALRNWPDDGEFPLSEHRPQAPTWLSTLTQ